MKFTKYLYLASLAILFSCGKGNEDPGPEGPQGPQGPQGPNGLKSLLDIQPVLPGTQCSTGGLVVKSGIDKNANNKLDTDEIENTQYVCNGNNGSYDKQVITKLTNIPVLKPGGATEYIIAAIPGFNKSSYMGVDSIVLFAQPYTNDQIPGSFAKVELYNMTDKQIITNSEISSSVIGAYSNFLSSKNCYISIPDKTIDLGIRLTGSYSANTGNVFMALYRK